MLEQITKILKSNAFSISVNIIAGIILWFDFLVTNEFGIEIQFLLVYTLFLLFPIIRFKKIIITLVNLIIIVLATYSFFILVITAIGFGFSGRDEPLIYELAVIVCIVLFISKGIDIVKNIEKR